MQFTNPPANPPAHMLHRTFPSRLAGHEIGYNIYLPPDYAVSGRRSPVIYHLHGWTGSESSEIEPMAEVYQHRDAITVFPNLSLPVEDPEHFPIESVIIDELIPFIDSEYRTLADRESRGISGFSMGGGMAFYYAVKYPELFASVTAYAGTYHHYYDQGFATVDAPIEKAAEFRQIILGMDNPSAKNILHLVNRQADAIRSRLRITLHVGTADILHCDNEIMHLHLDSLGIPHEYRKFDGATHDLWAIV